MPAARGVSNAMADELGISESLVNKQIRECDTQGKSEERRKKANLRF